MATVEHNDGVVLFPMTSDRFCKLPPSDQFKLELLDGEVMIAARPIPPRQHFLFQLGVVIEQWIKPRKLGRILLDTLIKLDDRWTPAPDLSFLFTGHLKRVEQRRIVGPVDLAVEVLSSSSKRVDRVTKSALYAKFGIPWYWIVDLKKRVLLEYEWTDEAYGMPLKASFDQPFSPRIFPGLIIDLASLEW